MAVNTLEFLKSQLQQVNAQIEPLTKVRIELERQISKMEAAQALGAYGLAIDDAVAITEEFMEHNHFTVYEREHRSTDTVYIAGLQFGEPYVTTSKGGTGLAFGATFDMVQRMKAAHS